MNTSESCYIFSLLELDKPVRIGGLSKPTVYIAPVMDKKELLSEQEEEARQDEFLREHGIY